MQSIDFDGDKMHVYDKIKNFMTDRSATEEKVNKTIIENINTCNNSVNADRGDIHSFKCAVHPLLQFQEVCTRELRTIESEYSVNIDSSISETSTQCLLRFISKLFFKDGSGDPLNSKIYLKSIGIDNIPIENFRGNRFNTFFYNAAGTYYLANHIIKYFQESKSTLNFTQNFILAALKNDHVLSLCKALGII